MKLSVSLPDADVAFLDAYAESHGIDTRSAAVQTAIRLLRAADLRSAYDEAFDEFAGEQEIWDLASADGLE
jgi:metal-responsive CopG/Arc/MetJ family transcriptional regulator